MLATRQPASATSRASPRRRGALACRWCSSPQADLEAARRAHASPIPSASLALAGVPSVAEAAALAAAGRRRGCIAAAHRGRAASPARSPRRETRHDRAFHRRRAGRGRPHHRARPRSHRALPGLPLCRLDRAAGAAALLPARRAHRRHRAAVARRDRGGVSSRRTRRARTWRGCIPAISRSGARWPSRSAGSSGAASPTR